MKKIENDFYMKTMPSIIKELKSLQEEMAHLNKNIIKNTSIDIESVEVSDNDIVETINAYNFKGYAYKDCIRKTGNKSVLVFESLGGN